MIEVRKMAPSTVTNGYTICEKKTYSSMDEVSDGYHTFGELYHHRTVLFATIANMNPKLFVKSRKHNNEESNPMYAGYFIVSCETPEGQYSYHCENKYWDMFNIPEVDRSPKYDGHVPSDVGRMLSLVTEQK